jgi:hypothetical protein
MLYPGQVRRVLQALKGIKVIRVKEEKRVILAVPADLKERKVTEEREVEPEKKETQEGRDSGGIVENRVDKESPALEDQRDHQDHRGILDYPQQPLEAYLKDWKG